MADTETVEDWQEIKTAHINALKDGSVGVDSSFTVAGRTYAYKSVEEVRAFINLCDERIAILTRRSQGRPFGSVATFRKCR